MPRHLSVQNLCIIYTRVSSCQGQTCQQSNLASTEWRQWRVGLPQLSMKFLENPIPCHPRAHETWAVRRITDNEVLAGSQAHCSNALLTLMQLHWAGYMWRMDGGRMLEQLLGVNTVTLAKELLNIAEGYSHSVRPYINTV